MRILPLIVKIGGVSLGVVGGLLWLSNPGQQDYENYATSTLVSYIKNDFCGQATGDAADFLTSHCKSLVDLSRPQLGKVIANRTERQNFILFSIYETDLSLFDPLPSYRFQTVGLFQQFYVYHYEEL